MQKIYKIENLDCANCAAELENALHDVKGIADVSVSFMNGTMRIEFADEDMAAVMTEVRRVAEKIEPDCEIFE